MEKEINMNDMNQVADYAAHIIKEHFPESDAQRMIIQHLGIFSRFENNMCAISLAMGNIRSLAQKSLYQDKEKEEYIEALKNIEVIADSLHNVGGFLIAGVDCDAMHLYRHGGKENWPTGIPNNTEYISLKFFPNPSSSFEEYREFILTREEIAEISAN